LHERPVKVAVVADDAQLTERLRLADTPPVENEGVGRTRPACLRQRGAELLLHNFGVVAFGNADAVRDPEHMPVDRQSRNPERVAENNVRGLAADTRQLDERRHLRCGSSSSVVAFARALALG
jgi:hypothetical protein